MHTPLVFIFSIFCYTSIMGKDRFKSKIKFFIFIFTALKSVFLVHRFFKNHPKIKEKILQTPALISKSFKKPKKIKTYLKDFLIPNYDNNHTPSALRPRYLAAYALIIILAKLFISSYLFILYPTVLSAFTAIENEVLNLVNNSRADAQVIQLEIDSELSRAAQAKADDMIANDYFSHFGPDGKKPWDWIDYGKYGYSIAGENLGKDFITADAVHRALMASSTHKKNILNPRYRNLGIGIAAGKIDNRDTLVLVQMFGAMIESAPITNVLQTQEGVPANIKSIQSELFGDPAPTILNEPDSMELSKNITQVRAQTVEAAIDQPLSRDWIQTLMRYFDLFMFVVLGFLAIALLLNIFIQIRVQKPKTIFSTLLVITVILFFMFTNFHYLEGLARVVSIK